MDSKPASHQPGFTRVDNRVIAHYASQIGSTALAVYLVLSFHADNNTRQCYPSTRKIARLLHLSQPTVLKAICTLEAAGLIQVRRVRTKQGDRRANLYTLLPIGGAKDSLPPVLNDVEHRAKGALAEQDSINKTQENKRGGAATSELAVQAPPARPRDPYLDHPAVKAYRDCCKLTPNEAQRSAITETVTDMGRWQEVMRKWLLAGYRASNVDGMLDWYRNGIPERSSGNGKNALAGRVGSQGNRAYDRRESRPPETPEETARRDAEWESIRQSQNRSELDGR